jgi:hypothetical protein
MTARSVLRIFGRLKRKQSAVFVDYPAPLPTHGAGRGARTSRPLNRTSGAAVRRLPPRSTSTPAPTQPQRQHPRPHLDPALRQTRSETSINIAPRPPLSDVLFPVFALRRTPSGTSANIAPRPPLSDVLFQGSTLRTTQRNVYQHRATLALSDAPFPGAPPSEQPSETSINIAPRRPLSDATSSFRCSHFDGRAAGRLSTSCHSVRSGSPQS